MKPNLDINMLTSISVPQYHILLVDDDQDTLFILKRILEEHNYKLTIMNCSLEALNLFEKIYKDLDMIITDLSMPGLNGINLSKKVISIKPNIPIMICSGYVSPDIRKEAELLGIREILEKPMTIKSLTSAVKRILPDALNY